jgi:hypothetical protein
MEIISLVTVLSGLGWMAGVLMGGFDISWNLSEWPPVRLGRKRRSTWAQVMNDPTRNFV